MSNAQTTSQIVATSSDLLALHEATRETLPAVPLSKQAAQSWRRLPELNGTVRKPTADTPWTDTETANAAEALQVARDLRKTAQALEDTVREGALLTYDHQANLRAAIDPAFKAQLAKVPLDKNGHYILGAKGSPAQMPVPGTNVVFSAEYTVGKEHLSPESLAKLVDSRTITRREFKRLTRKTVVIDTDAVTRETSRNIGLRERLRGALKRSQSSITLSLRDAAAI